MNNSMITLMKDEAILHRATKRFNVIVALTALPVNAPGGEYLVQVVGSLLALLAMVNSFIFYDHYNDGITTLIFTLLIMPIIEYAIIKIPLYYFGYKNTEYLVTNNRIIKINGIFSKSSNEIALSDIEQVNVFQGVWGRLHKYGDIIINGIGGSKIILDEIGDPFEYKKRLQDAMPSQKKEETKKCPSCAETIKLEAIKCRFCGQTFEEN
jgi:uncharacterized membrane protein YdbT with pleckstrin-like domain